jgi:hypothetical protein
MEAFKKGQKFWIEKCKNRYGVIYCGEYESIEETKK